jgi:hypothetical protein
MKGQVTITVRGPRYYSSRDEEQFFSWLESIGCVQSVGGSGVDLEIILAARRIGQRDLLEMVAIFQRYKLNMRPLALLDTRRVDWFRNPNAYWYQKVFGARKEARK